MKVTQQQMAEIPATLVDTLGRTWTCDGHDGTAAMMGTLYWYRTELGPDAYAVWATPGWVDDEDVSIQLDVEPGDPVCFGLDLNTGHQWNAEAYCRRMALLLANLR